MKKQRESKGPADLPVDVDGKPLGEMCYLDEHGRVQDRALWEELLGEDLNAPPQPSHDQPDNG